MRLFSTHEHHVEKSGIHVYVVHIIHTFVDNGGTTTKQHTTEVR